MDTYIISHQHRKNSVIVITMPPLPFQVLENSSIQDRQDKATSFHVSSVTYTHNQLPQHVRVIISYLHFSSDLPHFGKTG